MNGHHSGEQPEKPPPESNGGRKGAPTPDRPADENLHEQPSADDLARQHREAHERLLTVVPESSESADNIDALKEIGVVAAAIKSARLNAILPRGKGSEVLLVGTELERFAGDIFHAGCGKVWFAHLPPGFEHAFQYLNAAIDATKADPQRVRSVWFSWITGNSLLLERVNCTPTGEPGLPQPIWHDKVVYKSLSADEVRSLKPADYLIESLMPEGVGFFYGPTMSGKTFAVLDICEHMCRGMTYRGLQVQAGPCYLFAGEGYQGLSSRLQAWAIANPSAPPRKFDLRIVGEVPHLGSPSTLQQSIERMQRTIAAAPVTPIFVGIDTLSCAVAGSNENDNGQLASVVEAVKDVRTVFPMTSIYFLHHPRKAGGEGLEAMRGGGVLSANTDAVIQVDRAGDIVTLKVEKAKDGQTDFKVRSKMLTVDTGRQNRFGKTITSCALVATDAKEVATRAVAPAEKALQVLDAAGVEGCTRAQFCAAAEMKGTAAWELLQQLVAEGKAKARKLGRAWRYWQAQRAPKDE